jgi:type III secretion protein L
VNTFAHSNRTLFTILPQNKVLKASDYLAYSNAQELICAAEVKAQEIVSAAEDVYAAEKEKGYQDGIQAGKAQLSQQITETAVKVGDYLREIEKDLVNIIINAMRKIIGEFDDEVLTAKVVHNALQLFQNQQPLTLRVAPALQQALAKKRDTDFQAIPCLNVIADPGLAPGTCILESEIGSVDASIETQLKAIESALMKHTQALR